MNSPAAIFWCLMVPGVFLVLVVYAADRWREARTDLDNTPTLRCDCQHPVDFHDGPLDACTACYCPQFFVAADVDHVRDVCGCDECTAERLWILPTREVRHG